MPFSWCFSSLLFVHPLVPLFSCSLQQFSSIQKTPSIRRNVVSAHIVRLLTPQPCRAQDAFMRRHLHSFCRNLASSSPLLSLVFCGSSPSSKAKILPSATGEDRRLLSVAAAVGWSFRTLHATSENERAHRKGGRRAVSSKRQTQSKRAFYPFLLIRPVRSDPWLKRKMK